MCNYVLLSNTALDSQGMQPRILYFQAQVVSEQAENFQCPCATSKKGKGGRHLCTWVIHAVVVAGLGSLARGFVKQPQKLQCLV